MHPHSIPTASAGTKTSVWLQKQETDTPKQEVCRALPGRHEHSNHFKPLKETSLLDQTYQGHSTERKPATGMPVGLPGCVLKAGGHFPLQVWSQATFSLIASGDTLISAELEKVLKKKKSLSHSFRPRGQCVQGSCRAKQGLCPLSLLL